MTRSQISKTVSENKFAIGLALMVVGWIVALAVRNAHADDAIRRNAEFREAFGPEVRVELRMVRETLIEVRKDLEQVLKALDAGTGR